MERVQNYFLRRVRKGYVPSLADLLQYVKKYEIPVPGDKSRKLRALRRKWKFMGRMTPFKKPSAYFSMSYPKLGLMMVDLLEFRPDLRGANEGCAGKCAC